MFKLLRFTCVSICIAALSVFFAFREAQAPGDEISPELYYFPVLMTGEVSETAMRYAQAIQKFDESVLQRQAAIKQAIDSVPLLQGMNKVKEGDNSKATVFQLNWSMMAVFAKDGRYLDSLVAGNAFLGKDTEDRVLKANKVLADRQKRESESQLPKATRDKQGLYADAKADPEQQKNKIAKGLKFILPELISQNKAFFVNSSYLPIFADTNLLSQYSQLDRISQVSQYSFQIMAIRNAYPETYNRLDPEFRSYVSSNDWYGLFRYAQAKANPLQEMNMAYLNKYKRVHHVGS